MLLLKMQPYKIIIKNSFPGGQAFPGGPVVRPLPSNVRRVQVRSLVGELRSHMSCGHKAKHRSNIVTNSIKVFKNGLH